MRGFSIRILLLAFCLVGCKPSLPDGILSERAMEEILYDYHMAMGLAESESGNVADNRYIRVHQVFDKHRISEAEFDSSMVYWCKHSETLYLIMRRVSERLDRKAEILGVNSEQQVHDAYAALSQDGDTADIWKGSTFRLVLGTTRQNVFRFIIPADSTFREGDTFLWVFTPQSLSSKANQDVYVQFSVKYEGDTVAATTRTLFDDRPVAIEIGENSVHDNLRIVQVSGCVYIPPSEKGQFALTALSHMALVRYHHEKEIPVVEDSTEVIVEDNVNVDTAEHVRLAPHDVRGGEAKEHKIQIVKEKNTKWVRRKRR